MYKRAGQGYPEGGYTPGGRVGGGEAPQGQWRSYGGGGDDESQEQYRYGGGAQEVREGGHAGLTRIITSGATSS